MGDLSLRDATVEDSSVIADLMTQIDFPNTPEEMEQRLNELLNLPDYHAIVAEKDGKVIGMLGVFLGRKFEKKDLFGRILTMAVDKEYRFKGIGGLLMEQAEKWLISKGANLVVIYSGEDSSSAHGFYKQQGFQKSGVRFIKDL
ncbi:GNAT family N-acetyltransferase [bacterium]|nr:GNAT family N-acetyltransferase [bacterium]